MPPSIKLPASLPAAIPNARPSTILTISAGAVTPDRTSHVIAAETGTADDLATVNTTNFSAGDTINVSADAGDTITVKATGGNITTDTGSDIVLDAVTKYATLHVTAGGVVASLGGAGRLLTGEEPAYGVTTAGAADETSAISAALTAAALIGPTGRKGGVVTLPAGKILFTAQISIPAGVTLRGLGQQLTELVYGGASGPDGIVLGNRSTLLDLMVNGANLTTSAVICTAVQDALVERVYSLDAKNQGFAFSEGANRCRLIGCTAEGAGDRGLNIGVGAVTPAFGIGVYDFKAVNCDDAGILLGHSVSQCIVDGFEIVGTDNVSLWLIANSFQNIIKNGIIRDPRAGGATNYGIWLQGKVYRNILSDIVVSGHQTGLCDEAGDHGGAIAADGLNGDNFGNIISRLTLSGNGSGVGDGLLVGGTYSIGISNITKANPGVITTSSAHGLVTGDEVQVKGGGGGMTELSDVWVTVTVLTTTTFSIGINTTSYTAYSTGGAIVPHQVENELFSDIVINNFGVGIRDYFANIGRYNRFQNMQMFNVGSKISFNAVNYREQVFSNIDGVTNFGYLSNGDANQVLITPPAFSGGSPIRNPYPYPVFVYINHNGSGGTLGSVQILGRGQSSASGFNTAGAALFGNSQNGPYIIPPGGSIIVGISTGVAADYSWQWFSAW